MGTSVQNPYGSQAIPRSGSAWTMADNSRDQRQNQDVIRFAPDRAAELASVTAGHVLYTSPPMSKMIPGRPLGSGLAILRRISVMFRKGSIL